MMWTYWDKQILKIAFPAIFGFLGLILFESINVFWVGKLSSLAVAALAASSFIKWGTLAIMQITTIGASNFTANFVGANNLTEKHNVFREIFWVSLLIALLMTLTLHWTIDPIFQAMKLTDNTKQMALDYFRIVIYTIPSTYLLNITIQIFNAHSDTKVNTIIMGGTLLLNAVLDPLIIFGWGGFPQWGLQGAAIATAFSEFIGLAIRWYLLRKKNRIPSIFTLAKVKFTYTRSIIKLGIGSVTTNLVWDLVFPALTVVISAYGMAPLAALNVGTRIEAFAYFSALGFSVALSALVAQQIGANKPENVPIIVKKGLIWISIIFGVFTLAFTNFSEFLVSLINSDPEIIEHSSNYLRIVGMLEIFLAWEMVIEGAFNGLRNSKIYMLIRVPLTLFRIPLAWLLVTYTSLGVSGVWWAISLTTGIKGILMLLVYIRYVKLHFKT